MLDNSPCFFRFLVPPGRRNPGDHCATQRRLGGIQLIEMPRNLDHWGDTYQILTYQYLSIMIMIQISWSKFQGIITVLINTYQYLLWMVAKFCTKRMTESPTKEWDNPPFSTGAGFLTVSNMIKYCNMMFFFIFLRSYVQPSCRLFSDTAMTLHPGLPAVSMSPCPFVGTEKFGSLRWCGNIW